MDPASLAFSLVGTTAVTLHSVKRVKEFIDGIEGAPKAVSCISNDLEALLNVLELLENTMQDARFTNFPLKAQILSSLDRPLKNCAAETAVLLDKLSPFVKSTGKAKLSKWRSFIWNFREKEFADSQRILLSYKASLDVAVGVASLAITGTGFVELDSKVTWLKRKLDIDSASVANTTFSGSSDAGQSDHHFTMKRYLLETESVMDRFSEPGQQSPAPLSPVFLNKNDGPSSIEPGPTIDTGVQLSPLIALPQEDHDVQALMSTFVAPDYNDISYNFKLAIEFAQWASLYILSKPVGQPSGGKHDGHASLGHIWELDNALVVRPSGGMNDDDMPTTHWKSLKHIDDVYFELTSICTHEGKGVPLLVDLALRGISADPYEVDNSLAGPEVLRLYSQRVRRRWGWDLTTESDLYNHLLQEATLERDCSNVLMFFFLKLRPPLLDINLLSRVDSGTMAACLRFGLAGSHFHTLKRLFRYFRTFDLADVATLSKRSYDLSLAYAWRHALVGAQAFEHSSRAEKTAVTFNILQLMRYKPLINT